MNDVYTSNIKAIVNVIYSLAEGKSTSIIQRGQSASQTRCHSALFILILYKCHIKALS